MRYLSLFSGIEAASVAWTPLGWEPVAFSEIESFPDAVLAYRYPDIPNLGDITMIDWGAHKDILKVDLVVGGSPCQSFSISGRREGLHGASGLMWEYVRAIRSIRPRWLVWENVQGALSSSHGEDFLCLLRALDGLGYDLAWRLFDSQFFGVPQRRRRVFLVGSLGTALASEALFEEGAGLHDMRTSDKKRSDLTMNDAGRSDGGEEDTIYSLQLSQTGANGRNYRKDCAYTLDCAGPSSVAYGRIIRHLTPVECERLQGFPDGWTDVPYKDGEHAPDRLRYKALGNSMAVPVMRWIGRSIEKEDDR